MKNILTLLLGVGLAALTAVGFAKSDSPTPIPAITYEQPAPAVHIDSNFGYLQTSTPNAANPLATLNLGLSGFVQGKHTYVVVLAPLSNFYKSPTGKYSIDLQGFTGYESLVPKVL